MTAGQHAVGVVDIDRSGHEERAFGLLRLQEVLVEVPDSSDHVVGGTEEFTL